MVHHSIPSNLKMWWPSRLFVKNWWPSLMVHHWWTIIVMSDTYTVSLPYSVTSCRLSALPIYEIGILQVQGANYLLFTKRYVPILIVVQLTYKIFWTTNPTYVYVCCTHTIVLLITPQPSTNRYSSGLNF